MLLNKLTPSQAAILESQRNVIAVAENLAQKYGESTALRYLKLELAHSPKPKSVLPIKVAKESRYEPKTKLRGKWAILIIDGIEVKGLKTNKGWRCPFSALSLLICPKAHYGWLDSSVRRDKYFYREVLRPQGFTGVKRKVICDKMTYVTVSEADTRIVIANRHLTNFGGR